MAIQLSKRLISTIEEEIELLERRIEARVEFEYEQTFDNLQMKLMQYDWIELPDYKLMQYQKDAINQAIEMILSGELEITA